MTVNITPLHGPRPRTQAGRERNPERRHHHSGHGQRKPQEGDVIAVGAGKIEKGHRVPLDVKVGDRQIHGQRNPDRRPGVSDPPRRGNPDEFERDGKGSIR